MSLIDRLLKLAALWAAANDRSQARLATVVANDGKLFDRLAAGSSCTVATLERFLAFFRDTANWRDGSIPAEAAALLATVAVQVGDAHAGASIAEPDRFASGKIDEFTAEPVRLSDRMIREEAMRVAGGPPR